jgi:protein disulfide-isomerase A1
MRLSTFSGAALSLVLAALVAAEGASDVIDLTADTFESTVNGEDLALVEFFAPWCGHCKALAPHYEEAATELKNKSIKLMKVDCVDQADLCQQKGITGYPTLKVYRKGEATDYTGPRQTDGIISYMTKQALPAVSEVTADKHEEFTKADKIVAVAYLASPTDAPAAEFSSVANTHRDDFLFGLVTDEAAIKAAGVTPPAIVLYRSFDEHKTEFPYPVKATTKTEIADWIKTLRIPVIDQVSGENYNIYAQSELPLAYLFVDPSKSDHEAHVEAIRPVAAKFRGKVNFVWIDSVRFGDHAKALNLHEATWPSFVVQDLKTQLKYPLEQTGEVKAADVETLVEKFVAGKLEPTLKSAPIPESQDEPVWNLVGKQFDEVVYDDKKDVFVEFYASWCGHCKRLKPTWDQLAETFSNSKDHITIAKMEAQDNDLPPSVPFRISGFPTLKFKPAGGREWIDYDGDRSLESLVAFVQEHAKNKLEPKANDTAAQAPVHEEL